jgi:hypothetical protein
MRDFNDIERDVAAKTYEIEQRGKWFATVCRTDGFWAITFISKNKRAAKRKGDEFVSGKRNATRKYVTPLGAAINEAQSRVPKNMRNPETLDRVAIAAMVAFQMENP